MRGNHAFGNDKNMHRSLRVDVVKRDEVRILINNTGRNLAGDDFLK